MTAEWIHEGWPVDGTAEERADWLEKWAPRCPIGNPQRVRRCMGYRERDPGRLQLRVALGGNEGVCEVVVDETDEIVTVRVFLCYDEDEEDNDRGRDREYINCPVHVYLDKPLDGRTVVDFQSNEELPLYVPNW
jgi:hypothetical protein